jgi:hypothetical protein
MHNPMNSEDGCEEEIMVDKRVKINCKNSLMFEIEQSNQGSSLMINESVRFFDRMVPDFANHENFILLNKGRIKGSEIPFEEYKEHGNDEIRYLHLDM